MGPGSLPARTAPASSQIRQIRQISTEPVSRISAAVIQASGLAVLPGLIDLHVHLGALLRPDTSWVPRWLWHLVLENWLAPRLLHRRLKGYLADGDTTLRSLGDAIDAPGDVLLLRQRIESQRLRGPRLLAVGPVFTAPDGHPVGTMARGNRRVQEKAARGLILQPLSSALAVLLCAAGVLAMGYGVGEVLGLPLRSPEVAWQVPSGWIRGRSPLYQAIVWGTFLGPGLVTRNPYAGMWLLPLWIGAHHSLVAAVCRGIGVGAVHGAARAIGVLSSRRCLDNDPSELVLAMWRWRFLDGIFLLVAGGGVTAYLFAVLSA